MTFTKKGLQIFYLIKECDSDFKEWCFSLQHLKRMVFHTKRDDFLKDV
jgi:hypothetical protein